MRTATKRSSSSTASCFCFSWRLAISCRVATRSTGARTRSASSSARRLPIARRGGSWDALAAITRLSRLGCRTDDLIVRPFNGRLFARRAAPVARSPPDGRGSRRRSAARDGAMRGTLVALGSRKGRSWPEEITYARSWRRTTRGRVRAGVGSGPGRKKDDATAFHPAQTDRHVLYAAGTGGVRRATHARAARCGGAS